MCFVHTILIGFKNEILKFVNVHSMMLFSILLQVVEK